MNQLLDTEVVNRNGFRIGFEIDRGSTGPGESEINAINLVREIDAIRRQPELENNPRILELGMVDETGDGTLPELIQRLIQEPDELQDVWRKCGRIYGFR